MAWNVTDYPEPSKSWWDNHGGTSEDEYEHIVDEWEEFEMYDDADECDHDEYGDESFP